MDQYIQYVTLHNFTLYLLCGYTFILTNLLYARYISKQLLRQTKFELALSFIWLNILFWPVCLILTIVGILNGVYEENDGK